MPKAGTFAALKQLRPIEADFGKILKEEEEKQFQRRQLEEAKKAKAAAAKAKKRSEITKDFKGNFSSIVDVVTKTKSIDEAFARGINSARDNIGQTFKDVQNNPELANDVGVQMRIQNLSKFSTHLKTISDRYTEYTGMITKGMTDGSLSDWNSEVLSDLNSIFRDANLDIQSDPNTGLPIGVIAELDEEGLPTGELKRLNLIEILDGRGLQEAVSNFDLAKSVSDIGSKLGTREVKTQRGFVTTEIQDFSSIEDDVRDMVKGFIGNEINPTDIAKSIWSDAMGQKKKDLDSDDMKRIEDFYTESTRIFYNEKNFRTIDQRAALAARKSREKKGASTPIVVGDVTTGIPIRRTIKGVEGFTTSLNPNPVFVTKTNTEAVHVQNLTILDNGDIYADVTTLTRGTGGAVVKESGEIDYLATAFAKAGWEQAVEKDRKLNSTFLSNLSTNIVLRDDKGNTFKSSKELADFLKKKFKEKSRGQPLKSSRIDTSKYN